MPIDPAEYPENDAVLYQVDANGNALTKGAISLTEIEVLDLLSEGEIEGLCTGDFPRTGISGNAGEIGWQRYNFVPYKDPPNTTNSRYLRSIYWNEVPIVSSDNKYNFQRIDTSFTNGTPDGSLVNQSNSELTITRPLGERLRGSVLSTEGNADDINKDYIKYYRILNKECQAVIVNIKFNSLSETLRKDDDADKPPEDPNEAAAIVKALNIAGGKGGNQAGDTRMTYVEYEIHYRPLFSTLEKTPSYYFLGKRERIIGKINYGYLKSSRVNFYGNFADEKDFLGWEIKIVRITPDSLKINIRNQTVVDSITEVYADSFLYPNSAIVRGRFSAEFFSQAPDRAFDVKLLKVKIPDNYDPVLKNYSETANGWSGNFKSGKYWTDNPAWCYYDLVTNKRYGLGKYIAEANIDKWTLYEIGKYCDQLVPDGFGQLEPRFTCNLIINSRDEAYKVIDDTASIFRGITYYGAGTIYAVQDSPKDPVYQFTNANVEEGNFTYQSSSKRVRNTIALVRYNDRNNFYKPAVEYVEDIDGIRQYGIREREITAFGCTSRGQANRLGKWALLTETTETETVNFTAGLEGSFLRPGDIIQIFDSNRKYNRHAGRTIKIENNDINPGIGARVLLDSTVNLNTGSLYDFNLLTPTFFYDTTKIIDLSGVDYANIRRDHVQTVQFSGWQASGITGDGVIRTEIVFYKKFDTGNYTVTGNLVWSLGLNSGYLATKTGIVTYNDSLSFVDKSTDYYRVLRSEEDDFKYKIVALQNNIYKYNDLETGLYFERPVLEYKTIPQAPESLAVYVRKESKNSRSIGFSVAPRSMSGITNYKIYASQNSGAIFNFNPPSDVHLVANLPADVLSSSFNVFNTGNYYFKVYSNNEEANLLSITGVTGYATVISSYPIRDVLISSLRLYGDESTTPTGSTTYPANTGEYFTESPTFTWQVGIEPGSTLPLDFNFRVTIRSPSNSNTPSSTIYYQDTGYQYPFNQPLWSFPMGLNANLSGGPYRDYDVVVEAIDCSGLTSAGNSVRSYADYTESNWSTNPAGYDIIYVTNPKITGVFLSTGGLTDFNMKTEQWINTDGSVQILLTSGNLPFKTKGGYIYSSTGIFTTGHINSGLVTVSEMTQVNSNSKLLTSANRINYTNSGWVAISLVDSFQLGLSVKGFDISRDGNYSNIVPIYSSGDSYVQRITKEIQLFNVSNFADFNKMRTERMTEGNKTYAVSKFIDAAGIEFIGGSKLI